MAEVVQSSVDPNSCSTGHEDNLERDTKAALRGSSQILGSSGAQTSQVRHIKMRAKVLQET